LWPWRSRLSERLPYRSSVPCPRRFRFATACRVDWTVSGRIDRTCGVRKAVRSWRPSWTPDTTAQTSDGDQACGRCGIEHGRRWSRRAVPMLGAAEVGRRRACALPSCPVRARTCRPRGWPWPAGRGMVGRWALEVSAAWPPLSGPGPDPVAGRSPRTGDVRPTGRSRGPPCPSPGPAAAGCPQRLIGGDGVQTGIRRLHLGGGGRPA
jgi:hypothetical protein